jgi:hypothetical protein
MPTNKSTRSVVWVVVLTLALGLVPVRAFAQNPTGNIEGTITDAQGAVLKGATVEVSQKETGFERSVSTDDSGAYRITNLAPGNYDVSIVAQGFKKAVADNVTVAVGTTTPLDVQLTAGGANETIEVQGGEATVDRTDNQVAGVVNPIQIANLPLNGRNFLDLARLQPGAETVDGGGFDPTKANYTGVALGGAGGRSTQIAVDGGSVVDNVVGTTVQNFSQEIISEFQVGISNQDISSGASASGTINVLTKTGNNDFHGNGYLYYRDDQFSAFPGLDRLVDTDTSDDFVPFQARRIQFDRQQYGATIGGPIVQDKAFFFGNIEVNNQDSVSLFQIPVAAIRGFNGFGPQPFNQLLITARVDWRVNDSNTFFGRYSHDDNDQIAPFAPATGIVPRESASGIFSSNNQFNTNRADGFVVGLTTTFSSTIVNDLRYNFNDFANEIDPDPASAPGSPELRVIDAGQVWKSGTNYITPQKTYQVRNQLRDDLNWALGNHNLRFGVNYERSAISGQFAFAKPARIRIYGPQTGGLPVLQTEADFLNSPVRDIFMGIGNDLLPFDNPDGATINNRWQFYVSDIWKVHPRLTVNYGLSYRYDSNLWNTQYGRPDIIAPLFTDGGAPPSNDTNNWAPRVGFAWDVNGNAKTVVRGGAGIYYDNTIDNLRLFETADVIAPGSELFLGGNDIQSALLPGGNGQFGATPASTSGFLTLAQALALMGALRADLESRTFASDAPTSIEAFGAISGPLFATDFQLPYAIHYSLGIQRELPYDMVLQADLNYRKGLHEALVYDANHIDAVDANGNSTPYLNLADWQNSVPYANSGAFSVYKALLVRLDKRFTNDFQFTASYALSRVDGFGGDTLGLGAAPTNLYDFRADYGATGNDRTHRFVFSGLYEFPRYDGDGWKEAFLDGWTVSGIHTMYSGLPYQVFLPDFVDLSGTGTFASYLPGTNSGSIGRSVSNIGELNSLISAYNASLTPGSVDFYQTPLRPLALLPGDTPIGGDSVLSTDIRLTKKFYFGETMHLDLIAEGFNVFNIANLVHVGDQTLVAQEDVDAYVNDPAGNPSRFAYPFTTLRPNQRQTSTFGSGGPRAFQFAVKFTF